MTWLSARMGLGRFFGRGKDPDDGGLGIPGAADAQVHVTRHTVDVSDDPDVVDQVTDMLKAQGIDITAMASGTTIQMGQPMDPEDAERFRQSMLGMLGSMGIEAPGAGPAFGAVAPGAPADDGVDDVVASLERLVRLRDAGALTPEEFAAQKARILGGG